MCYAMLWEYKTISTIKKYISAFLCVLSKGYFMKSIFKNLKKILPDPMLKWLLIHEIQNGV